MWRVIERELKKRNKTAYWLSKQVGMTRQQLYAIRDGVVKTVYLETAFKIADVLGIDVNEFRKEG